MTGLALRTYGEDVRAWALRTMRAWRSTCVKLRRLNSCCLATCAHMSSSDGSSVIPCSMHAPRFSCYCHSATCRNLLLHDKQNHTQEVPCIRQRLLRDAGPINALCGMVAFPSMPILRTLQRAMEVCS